MKLIYYHGINRKFTRASFQAQQNEGERMRRKKSKNHNHDIGWAPVCTAFTMNWLHNLLVDYFTAEYFIKTTCAASAARLEFLIFTTEATSEI